LKHIQEMGCPMKAKGVPVGLQNTPLIGERLIPKWSERQILGENGLKTDKCQGGNGRKNYQAATDWIILTNYGTVNKGALETSLNAH